MNNRYLMDFLSLFFPNCCTGCSNGLLKGEDLLCSRCVDGLPFLDYGRYRMNPLACRLVTVMQFSHALALLKFQPGGLVQQLLHALKYGNQPEVGLRMGQLLGERLHSDGIAGDFDLIIPVPLFHARERMRGYNQSKVFADGLSGVLRIPVGVSVVERHRRTTTQTKYARAERWNNMQDAFRVVKPRDIEGRRILMVDDVITTGATIEACSAALLPYGPAAVAAACIADVP